MTKTFIGPQLRQLRRERRQTQAEMAKALGVSAGYVNLLENNQRSLSVRLLMALADAYQVDWRDVVRDETSNHLSELRNVMRDPMFSGNVPDLQEMRAAIEHAPRLVEQFVTLYGIHRRTLERIMRQGRAGSSEALLASSAEAVIHDFFRDNSNYFDSLERAAEQVRREEACDTDDIYAVLKARLANAHGIAVRRRAAEDMTQALRLYDREARIVHLSEALDHCNQVFQLAHVVCLVEFQDLLNELTASSGITNKTSLARCQIELANYFAAAFLMPYEPFLQTAESTAYDIDRIVARFAVSFEQACHRLTTMQRPGAQGVPFFFLRVDKAGNVTKRFNSTSFHLAEYGGACPVWKIHMAFRTPGVILPQFVELPDGERFFTISRTADRPAINLETQDHRLSVALGCELKYAKRLRYAASFNIEDEALFSKIGINCHLCPRQACSQRAHQPVFMELPVDTARRGNTRYES
ncbi:short-chain fatty acyl-CoA regulator family protein [Pseudorhodoplanes sp.]|uniref:helix-turn-helix domain-containing protein n=1 Tax=Pseudorhodoplanes sp. TaxID=1934341 RepID=UPI00391C1E5F